MISSKMAGIVHKLHRASIPLVPREDDSWKDDALKPLRVLLAVTDSSFSPETSRSVALTFSSSGQ